ncbi:hypothetical protein [Streptomyces sp. cg36]|uniref:hypothetical protein n=1 Tax=Streptomyces sp. cg36 TaxID=3238798 RepID=UPI0034E253BC
MAGQQVDGFGLIEQALRIAHDDLDACRQYAHAREQDVRAANTRAEKAEARAVERDRVLTVERDRVKRLTTQLAQLRAEFNQRLREDTEAAVQRTVTVSRANHHRRQAVHAEQLRRAHHEAGEQRARADQAEQDLAEALALLDDCTQARTAADADARRTARADAQDALDLLTVDDGRPKRGRR